VKTCQKNCGMEGNERGIIPYERTYLEGGGGTLVKSTRMFGRGAEEWRGQTIIKGGGVLPDFAMGRKR